MKGIGIESAQERVARALAKDYDMHVVFDSDGPPCADLKSKVIHLPRLPEKLDDKTLKMIRGFNDHEAGHFIYTDPKYSSEEWFRHQLEQLVMNVLEDVRVNYRMSRRYLGAARNIEFIHKEILKDYTKPGTVEAMGREARALMKLLCDLEETDKAAGVEIEWGPDATEMTDRIHKLIPDLKDQIINGDCADIKRLSEQVFDELFMDTDDEVEFSDDEEGGGEDAEGGGSGGRAGEKADVDDDFFEDEDDEESDEEGEEERPEGEIAESGEEDEDGEEDSGGEGLGDKGEGDGPSREECDVMETEDSVEGGGPGKAMWDKAVDDLKTSLPSERLKDAIEKAVEGAAHSRDAYRPVTDGDKEYDLTDEKTRKTLTGDRASRTKLGELLKKLRPSVSRMRQEFLLNMLAKSKAWVRNLDRGALDDRNVARIALANDSKLFKKRLPRNKIDTAVSLVVDCSGSMCGSQIKVATDTAILFAETLHAVGIPFEVLGFSAMDHGYVEGRYYDEESSSKLLRKYRPEHGFHRWLPLAHYIAKSFDTPYTQVKDSILSLREVPLVQNVDGESVMWAAKRLAARKEPRKILIVMSDGMPCSSREDESVLARHLKQVVQDITRAGIETVGVGIQTNCVKSFYPDWIVVDDARSLGREFYGKLTSILRKGA